MYYHVWFVTKYRRATLEGTTEKIAKKIFAECIKRHNYKVLELGTNKDHVHVLLEVADKKNLPSIVRTLKAVSAKEIGYYRRKPVEEQRSFWARRYGSREIKQEEIEDIRKYIRDQRK